MWLIASFPALKINIDNYPAVRDYLKTFGKRLEQSGEQGCRKKTYNKWFETQDQISYFVEFEKEKIVYSEIVQSQQFHYDTKRVYPEATIFFITGNSIKYLLALLNTNFITSLFKKYYAGGGLGESGYRYKKAFFENLPIPKISEEAQAPFIELVDIILAKKEKGEDTTIEENKIDRMVYELYDLTEAEIKIVENSITN